jgi:hypothetical protein
VINEFRASTDGTLFAFYDPGNGPWFIPIDPMEKWTPEPDAEGWGIPEPWMRGRFVGFDKIDGFGFEWIRFLPSSEAAGEVLKLVKEWAEGEQQDDPSVGQLIAQLERKGFTLPEGEEDE